MITNIYLAGASSEIDRARNWVQRLRDAGIHVVSTWVDVIGKVGQSNPVDATIEQLTQWTLRDLAEVKASDLMWLLLPALDKHTVGAWVEMGYAHAARIPIVMSGPHRPIFTPVLAAMHFHDDESMFTEIVRRHNEETANHVERYIASQQHERAEPAAFEGD
jgi:hypothetical protein